MSNFVDRGSTARLIFFSSLSTTVSMRTLSRTAEISVTVLQARQDEQARQVEQLERTN